MISIKYVVWTSFLVLAISFYLNRYHNAVTWSYLSKISFGREALRTLNVAFVNYISVNLFGSHSKENLGEILMYPQELKEFNGKGAGGKLFLSILGRIFDVSRGGKFYGPGSHYHFFTGRDASRAFVTGDFSDSGLTDDVSDLDREQLRGLKTWAEFYQKEYKYIGKLVGRYYDSKGYETPYLIQVKELLRGADIEDKEAQKEKLRYPPCNSEWQVDKGSRVWCSKKSGGIERSWVGVPRKLYVAGSSSPRCACIRHPKEISSPGSHEPKIDDPQLEKYPDCSEDSHSCWIKV
ncbi:hypothetical protein J437_LFUL006380 [Ladona fulva]|uniref:Cytochrome b5 heme-binding domain-containing protein n=1 Tax=Ladona fulva TaxID=123851 RepID=A0A8K0K140_LADFU|nr:hypothetical protein J437_LFUL006380 [Ladona fulva]